jgi:hypothetical protein
MDIPAKIKMKCTAHGHGAKGLAFFTYEDAQGLDITVDARRASHRERFIETWRFRWLPGGEFRTYEDLRAAVAPLTPEQVQAERAKWPQMIEPPDESSGNNRCWLHTDRPGTHHGWVQASWHKYDCITAILCSECAAAAAADPGVIVQASEQRRAHVAALNAKEGTPAERLARFAAENLQGDPT